MTKIWKFNDKTDWGRKNFPKELEKGEEVVLNRLADQINFFNKRSKQNQNRYKWSKAATFLAAGIITASGALALPIWLVPVLGATIIFVESLLSMNSNQQNWLSYRKTCEALKHEKYLYLAKAGPYRGINDPTMLLAERIESILIEDHEIWLTTQKEQSKSLKTN